MASRLLSIQTSGRLPLRRVLREWVYRATRAIREAELTWLVVLSALALACVMITFIFRPSWPLTAYVLPLLLAMNAMSLRKLIILEVLTAGCLLVSLSLIEVTV